MEDFKLEDNGLKKANRIEFYIDSAIYKLNKDVIDNERSSLLGKKFTSEEEYFMKVKATLNDAQFASI